MVTRTLWRVQLIIYEDQHQLDQEQLEQYVKLKFTSECFIYFKIMKVYSTIWFY
jgi:hypothetical protein